MGIPKIWSSGNLSEEMWGVVSGPSSWRWDAHPSRAWSVRIVTMVMKLSLKGWAGFGRQRTFRKVELASKLEKLMKVQCPLGKWSFLELNVETCKWGLPVERADIVPDGQSKTGKVLGCHSRQLSPLSFRQQEVLNSQDSDETTVLFKWDHYPRKMQDELGMLWEGWWAVQKKKKMKELDRKLLLYPLPGSPPCCIMSSALLLKV